MNSKIIKTTKNPFLNREEIIIELKNNITPTKEEVISAIGKDAELTIIKKINTNFGKQNFTAEAVIYDSIEDKEKIEVIPKKIRKKLQAEKEAAQAAAKKAQEEDKKAEEEAKAADAKAAEATEEKTEATKEPKSEEVKTE